MSATVYFIMIKKTTQQVNLICINDCAFASSYEYMQFHMLRSSMYL